MYTEKVRFTCSGFKVNLTKEKNETFSDFEQAMVLGVRTVLGILQNQLKFPFPGLTDNSFQQRVGALMLREVAVE